MLGLEVAKKIYVCKQCGFQGGINCEASPQADFIMNHVLSNSPIPPSPAGRLEKLMSPWWLQLLSIKRFGMKCLYSRHKVALYSMPTMIKRRQAGALVLLQLSYLSGQPIRPCSFPIIELFCHVWMIHRIEPFVACSSCTCGPPKIARDGKRCPVLLPVFYVIFITVLSLIHKGNRPSKVAKIASRGKFGQ